MHSGGGLWSLSYQDQYQYWKGDPTILRYKQQHKPMSSQFKNYKILQSLLEKK